MSEAYDGITDAPGNERPSSATIERKKRRAGLRGAGFVATAQVTTPVSIKRTKAAKPKESQEPLFVRAPTFNVTTSARIDERLFVGSNVIQRLRARETHATIMVRGRTPGAHDAVKKQEIDDQGTTFTTITLEVLRKLDPDTEWKQYRPQLDDYEADFFHEASGSSAGMLDASVQRHCNTPLLQGLEAFRVAAAEFHGRQYDDYCHGAIRFGAYLLDQEEPTA